MSRRRDQAESLLHRRDLADADRAALGLLLEYRDGYWLGNTWHPCFRVIELAPIRVDWRPGLAAWDTTIDRVSPLDGAILITALHLAGTAIDGEALGDWWRHLDRNALALVLQAIAVRAGARAEIADMGDAPLFGSTGRAIDVPDEKCHP